tara:strand:+ start:444 stop:1589 length:1146 start_codon:yes stop_codon:yes gene_type:complete
MSIINVNIPSSIQKNATDAVDFTAGQLLSSDGAKVVGVNPADLEVSTATQGQIDLKTFKIVTDYATIQDAFNIGGLLRFPAGSYDLSGIIVKSNTKVIGDGKGITVLTLDSLTLPMFDCSGTYSGSTALVANEHIEFENITFKHVNNATVTGDGGCFIKAWNIRNCSAKSCEFLEFSGNAIYTKDTDTNQTNSEGFFIDNCEFKDSKSTAKGVYFFSESEYCTVNNSRFNNVADGVYLSDAGNNTIIGCVFLASRIYSANTSGLNSGKISIIGNKINHGSGIEIRNLNSACQYGSSIISNQILATSTHCIRITGGRGNIIQGNLLWANSGVGAIRLWSTGAYTTDYNNITGNTSILLPLLENLSSGTNNVIANNIENAPNT